MLRRVLAILVVAAILVPAAALGPGEQATRAQPGSCVFQLGFATLREMIVGQYGDIVGQCLENEWHNAFNGDALQQTTGGLLVWRKCDNWTAFTNGSTTWINGPPGLVTRPNEGPLFPFEASSCPGGPPGPPPGPPAPPPAPAAPTATAVPGNVRPTIAIRLDDDNPRQGQEFSLRLEASDDTGLESMWWWATDTSDNELRSTHTRNCRSATPCIESWTISTTDTGTISLHALARDINGQLADEVTREIRVNESAATATPTPSGPSATATPTATTTPTPTLTPTTP